MHGAKHREKLVAQASIAAEVDAAWAHGVHCKPVSILQEAAGVGSDDGISSSVKMGTA